jgi:HEAT repeat protein
MKKFISFGNFLLGLGLVLAIVLCVWSWEDYLRSSLQSSATFSSLENPAALNRPQRFPQTVSECVDELRHGNPNQRKLAASHLPLLGREAKKGVWALIKGLRDSDGAVRLQCAMALCEIAPGDFEVLTALLTACQSDQSMLPYVFRYLRRGDTIADRVVLLESMLHEPYSTAERAESAQILGQIGPAAKKANPQLISMLSSKNSDVRQSAAHALVAINPGDRELVEPLVTVGGTDRILWKLALVHLCDCYPDSQERAACLVGVLSASSTPLIRSRIAQELGAIGPKAQAAIPALVEALDDSNADVRSEAYWALAKIDSSALPPGQFRIPDWQTMSTWPGVLVLLAIPWVLMIVSVALAFAVRRFRYGKPRLTAADLAALEANGGPILERILAIRHQAATEIFEGRRKRGIPALIAQSQPAPEPDPSQSPLDRLMDLKRQGVWNPQPDQSDS